MKIALVIFLLIASQAKANFLPETMVLENDGTKPSNITEAQTNQVIAQLQKIYSPVVSSFGGELLIVSNWSSNQVNAFANRALTGNTWKVTVLGGLARNPELNTDGLTLIVCHELGHHLAGFPYVSKYNPFSGRWAANEGASDYFATQSCARKVWANEKAINAEFRTTVSTFVKNKCNQAWISEQDQNLCYRIAAASRSISNTLASLSKKPKPDFETPTTKVVRKTYNGHPEAQCRMDTYFQASLCRVSFNDGIIPGKKLASKRNSPTAEQEAYLYSCGPKDAGGIRPNCWFKSQL